MPAGHARLSAGLTKGSCLAGRFGLAALVILFGCESLQNAIASGETRTLSMHHTHTDESITITYKRNGRYDEEALKKIDWFLRDWRRQESTRMDPHLLDIVWEVVTELHAQKPIEIICGYRAPATNEMLRRRSNGVAKGSQHTRGKAMDFYIPDVSLEQLRYAGLRLQRGGVGFYPSSGSPFVHLDTGQVRHWPGISRMELARVFPNGRTVHVPMDGQPMSGYALALNDIEKRGNSPSQSSLDAARGAGAATSAKTRNPIAALFGVKDDDDDEAAGASARGASPAAADKPARVQTVAVPMPPVRPARAATVVAQAKDPELNGDAIAQRGGFDRAGGLAQIDAAIAGTKVAAADASVSAPAPATTLAYAPTPAANAPADRAVIPVAESTVQKTSAPPTAQRKAKPVFDSSPVAVIAAKVQNTEDPWTRAIMMAPDLQNYMSVTLLGAPDFKQLRHLMQKPTLTLAMSFTDDPLDVASTDHFTGETAVVFLATVPTTTQAAMLQR